MGIIGTIIVGFVVGLLARAFKPGKDKMGIILTTLLGIVGALVGSFIGRALGFYGPDEPAGWIMSILGAILVLALFGATRKGKTA